MTDWLQVAQAAVDDVLRPAASEVDRTAHIPRSHFVELASKGLYGLAFATADPARTLSDVGERLVSGCLSTAFVWAQHHGTLLRLAASSNQALKTEYLTRLQSGSLRAGVSGVAYANPRRALVRAQCAADGYVVSGSAPFVTGWGIVDVIGITAYDEENGTNVTFLADAVDDATMRGEHIGLSAGDASKTVQLVFDELKVPTERLMFVSRASSGPRTGGLNVLERTVVRINGSLALGIARAAIAEITRLGHLDLELESRLDAIRLTLDDAVAGEGDIFAARAAASRFAVHAATVCATIAGSRAVRKGEVAERLVREAAFALVCTSTPDIRAKILEMA